MASSRASAALAGTLGGSVPTSYARTLDAYQEFCPAYTRDLNNRHDLANLKELEEKVATASLETIQKAAKSAAREGYIRSLAFLLNSGRIQAGDCLLIETKARVHRDSHRTTLLIEAILGSGRGGKGAALMLLENYDLSATVNLRYETGLKPFTKVWHDALTLANGDGDTDLIRLIKAQKERADLRQPRRSLCCRLFGRCKKEIAPGEMKYSSLSRMEF